jgi:predicted RNA polymerase sigma factor
MLGDRTEQGRNVTPKRTSVTPVGGFSKVYNSNAERQKAYRGRLTTREGRKQDAFDCLRELLMDAFERGDSEWVTNHLPDEPEEWMILVAERLAAIKLVAHVED